jgi:hypothetical protein
MATQREFELSGFVTPTDAEEERCLVTNFQCVFVRYERHAENFLDAPTRLVSDSTEACMR